MLLEDGLLEPGEIDGTERFPGQHVDFARVVPFKERLFSRVYARFVREGDLRDFERPRRDRAW